MSNLRRGNKELIKNLNRAIVIEQIRVNQPISRTEIAKNTDLSLSTITNITEVLLKENLIMEIGTGISVGGRKPLLLKFNEEFGTIVGIKIEKNQLIFCTSNLDAKIKKKINVPFSKSLSGEEIITLIIEEIKKLVSEELSQNVLCGIGIAVSGLVDRDSQTLVYSPILAWENTSFKPIGDYFQVPLLIDNDANAFAMAHLWSRAAKCFDNFIGVTVGAGVGAGIVVHQQLYRGEFGGAGELGHTIIQREGSLCYCGQRGCLEMYANDDYLISEAERLVSLGVSTRLKDFEEITPEIVYSAADEGDGYAQDIILKQGENLGIGLKNVVNLFNPGAIILGGEGLKGRDFLLKGIQKELSTHFFTKHRQQLALHVSELGDDVWLVGACALVATNLFQVSIYK